MYVNNKNFYALSVAFISNFLVNEYLILEGKIDWVLIKFSFEFESLKLNLTKW